MFGCFIATNLCTDVELTRSSKYQDNLCTMIIKYINYIDV